MCAFSAEELRSSSFSSRKRADQVRNDGAWCPAGPTLWFRAYAGMTEDRYVLGLFLRDGVGVLVEVVKMSSLMSFIEVSV